MRSAAPLALISLLACEPPAPAHQADDSLRACAAVTTGQVTSVHGAVERLNALPAGADPACFLASLPRPLDVVATVGVTSAQPAAGPKSPRVFLLLEGLVVSVVPDGDGAKLIEFGEWTTPGRTLKAEVELPHTGPFTREDPFTRVRYSGGRPATTCGLCHREEAPAAAPAGAYESLAYQPQPRTFVTLEALRALHFECVEAADASPRCRLFHGLFDFGTVRQGAFSAETGLFAP